MADVKKTHIHIHHPGKNYDPELHITLDELRELGLTNLPEEKDVPGCAWIPRGSMVADPSKITVGKHPDDPQKMKVTMPMVFAHALTWETVNLEVDGDVDIEDLKRTLEGDGTA